ncbi:MAG: NTP transferase domain-containing protein [Actinobacteria bacterium]|nr:NTP transferase domain-containing protein [Actinomycetota bacterium]
MKVIILAGGLGTRLSEETESKPKPMVLIDDKPILWHLMNTFSQQRFDEFVLALGYRGDVIKRWLLDLNELEGDIIIDTLNKKVHHLKKGNNYSWKVTALETGLNTQTGGRIAQCMKAFPGERVIATYGDGLANISIKNLLEFHESHGKLATVTAVRPPARFGHLHIEGSQVTHFGEKNQSDEGWINGGFFVLEPEVAQFVADDNEPFEKGALQRLVEKGQLMAYHHHDFWQPMDTLRERNDLAAMAKETPPPWLRPANPVQKGR